MSRETAISRARKRLPAQSDASKASLKGSNTSKLTRPFLHWRFSTVGCRAIASRSWTNKVLFSFSIRTLRC